MLKRICSAVGVGLTALVFAAAAGAATPEDIYKDLADNGRLDGTYTQAELQAFLQSAQVQGYGNPVIVNVPPVVPPPAVTPSVAPPQPQQPTPGVAGQATPPAAAQPVSEAPPQVAGVQTPPVAETATADTLPFTGSELGLFALVGGALLLGGLALRASARRR